MRRANFEITEQDADRVVLRDLGPWDQFQTITNHAEGVVKLLSPILKDRRLFYYDSEGDYGELVVKDGKFLRFAAAKP